MSLGCSPVAHHGVPLEDKSDMPLLLSMIWSLNPKEKHQGPGPVLTGLYGPHLPCVPLPPAHLAAAALAQAVQLLATGPLHSCAPMGSPEDLSPLTFPSVLSGTCCPVHPIQHTPRAS